jgi:tripartite-type tricarboxylate transporter receptor subunit TctC
MLLPLAALAWSSTAPAADYPNRPLRLVVSFPPGGSADFQARILGHPAERAIGPAVHHRQPPREAVASSHWKLAAKSAPNGYTLLLGGMSHLTMTTVQYLEPSVTIRSGDFSPISMTSRVTLALTAGPSLPASSVKDLIALAKASPGKLSYVVHRKSAALPTSPAKC